jgi:3'-5' exonuclease
MPEQTIIAWDLETIPDLSAAARMLDLGAATETEVREALGSGFPKHPLHKIVCIGALVASRQPEGWRMDALGAPHINERTEAELISSVPSLALYRDLSHGTRRFCLLRLV